MSLLDIIKTPLGKILDSFSVHVFPMYNIRVTPENKNLDEKFLKKLRPYTGDFYVLSDGRVKRGNFSHLKTSVADLGVYGNGNPSHLHFFPSDTGGLVIIDKFSERNGELYLDYVRQNSDIPCLREKFKPNYI